MSTRWIALAALLVAAAPRQDAAAPNPAVERTGTFVPAKGAEVKLALETFGGALEFLEVTAHGSPVREGEVIARFDLKGVDDAIEAAERELRSVEVRRQNQIEQAKLDSEAADQRLEAATDALAATERTYDVWEKTELEFKHRGNELGEQNQRDGIEDQKDELAQLEKMYTADELTDATEEIVLKRQRRQLSRSQSNFELAQSRRKLDAEFYEREQMREKKNGVRDARRNRDRVARQVEIERRAREDALAKGEPEHEQARKKVEQLKQDRERLVVRAPRSGLLLHGAADDYRPGKSAPRHKVGGAATGKATLFTIVEPGSLQVALDVPESLLLTLSNGMAAKVVPVMDPGHTLVGRLRFERFPNPASAGTPENNYDGVVELDGTAPSLAPGMRCKIVLEGAKKSAP